MSQAGCSLTFFIFEAEMFVICSYVLVIVHENTSQKLWILLINTNKQTVTRAIRKHFFQQILVRFLIFFGTKKVCSLVFLIFRKCQPWVVPSMFLNFYQTPGSCSYKIVLIKQRWKQPPEVFCKNAGRKDFAKFREKHLCGSLF